MESGFFRSKEGFTVVQNDIVRDKTISMRAKGLYLVIQSFITLPGKRWRKDDFQRMVKEKQKAFDNAWNELKDNGYLKVHMYSHGYTWTVEYDLLYKAEPGPHTFYYDGKGNLSSTNEDRKKKKEEKMEQVKETEKVTLEISVEEKAAKQSPKEKESSEEKDTEENDNETMKSAEQPLTQEVDVVLEQMDDPEKEKSHMLYQKGSNIFPMPVEKPDILPQKVGNISEDDVLFGINGNGINGDGIYGDGTYGNGTYAEVGNNNNTYLINPYDNNYNQSLHLKEANPPIMMDGQTYSTPVVVFDPKEYIPKETTEQVLSILKENHGIPYKYVLMPKEMKLCIQVLGDWNHYCYERNLEDVEIYVYRLLMECLVEMATDQQTRNYNGSLVNYSHVIDQINILYNERVYLMNFINQVMERYINYLQTVPIRNAKQYMKCVIWSMFSSHQVDFQNFFYNTYGNGLMKKG